MPISQSRVGPLANYQDGATPDQLAGKSGELVVTDLHGKWYEHAVRGNVYYVSTVAAGLAIPISTTTAPVVMLWNPKGSGKNAELVRYSAAYVSSTSTATSIGLGGTTVAGSETATAAAITAFNQSVFGTNLFSAIFGGPNNSVMKSSANGTNTVTASTVWLATMAGESALIATTAMNPYSVNYDFEGTFILAPGTAVWVQGAAASGALLAQTLLWAEVPVL